MTTNSKTVRLEFENNVNHRLLLKTFYISSLYIWMELVELLVTKCKSQKKSFNDQLTVKLSLLPFE